MARLGRFSKPAKSEMFYRSLHRLVLHYVEYVNGMINSYLTFFYK